MSVISFKVIPLLHAFVEMLFPLDTCANIQRKNNIHDNKFISLEIDKSPTQTFFNQISLCVQTVEHSNNSFICKNYILRLSWFQVENFCPLKWSSMFFICPESVWTQFEFQHEINCVYDCSRTECSMELNKFSSWGKKEIIAFK